MPFSLLFRRQHLIYGFVLAVLLFFLRWLEIRFIIIDHATEVYAGGLAVLFTLLGIWLATKLLKPGTTTVVVEKVIPPENPAGESFVPDSRWIDRTGLSGREQEVLMLMAEGLSNQEIASRLFLSLHTVKSHNARLYEKLEVKRRTQAIEKGRRMGLVP